MHKHSYVLSHLAACFGVGALACAQMVAQGRPDVMGTVEANDLAGANKKVPYALVEVLNGSEVLKTDKTKADGRFAFSLNLPGSSLVKLFSSKEINGRTETGQCQARLTSGFLDPYTEYICSTDPGRNAHIR